MSCGQGLCVEQRHDRLEQLVGGLLVLDLLGLVEQDGVLAFASETRRGSVGTSRSGCRSRVQVMCSLPTPRPTLMWGCRWRTVGDLHQPGAGALAALGGGDDLVAGDRLAATDQDGAQMPVVLLMRRGPWATTLSLGGDHLRAGPGLPRLRASRTRAITRPCGVGDSAPRAADAPINAAERSTDVAAGRRLGVAAWQAGSVGIAGQSLDI